MTRAFILTVGWQPARRWQKFLKNEAAKRFSSTFARKAEKLCIW